MGYNIILTDGGRKTRDHIFDYYSNILGSPHITGKIYKDYLETLQVLTQTAGSYQIYEDISIQSKNIRRIRFRKYKYKIFYEIKGNTVYIKAILHDKQLPGKWLG